MASIFNTVLGGAGLLGGLLLGNSRANKATDTYTNALRQPAPPTYGPMGFFSNQQFGFTPQSQQNFDAFNKAAYDELQNFGQYKGVADTAYNTLSALTAPTRQTELDSLRAQLHGMGRLNLGQYRPSYDGETQVSTNPELQAFYEANRQQDLQNAYQSIQLQDQLRNSSQARAAGFQGAGTSMQSALLPFGNMSLNQQGMFNEAAGAQYNRSLNSAANFSDLLTMIGGDIFKGGLGLPSATKSIFGGTGSPLGSLTSPLQSLFGGNPFGNIGSALGLGLPNAGANGIIPSMSALGLSGLSPSASLALSGPLGGAFGQGAAASAAGASGGGAGGALGLTSGLGGLGLLGAGTLGLIGGLGLMTIGGNEKAVYTKHPQGLWSVESFLGSEPTLKPGRAGDEHGRTNPGKPASIYAREDFLMRPSKQADGFRQIEAQNQAAIQLYGADVKTLQLSGRLTPDMAFRIQQIGLGHDPGAQATFRGHLQQKAAKKAEKERQKELRHPGGRGN